MATITKRPRRGGGFTYRVQIRRKGHPTLSKSFDTRTQAQAWAREQDTAARLAQTFADARGRGKTLAALIDRYMDEYEGRDSSRVQRLAWWKDKVGTAKLPDVTPDLVADALDDLRAGRALRSIRGGAARPTGRVRSEATVNRYHAALSAVYQHALRRRWGWVKGNPCRDVQRGQEGSGRRRYLSHTERERLLEACRDSDWSGLYPLVLLALSTGARLGELLSLRWADVDVTARRARLHDSKNGEPRSLPLATPVCDALEEFARIRRIDSDLLFPAKTNANKPADIHAPWHAALRAAEIEDFRFHDLRHSCASYLAMNGATLVEIADVLGHKTLAMVKRYAHLADQHKADLVDRVTGTWLPGVPTNRRG